ncbi:MAG TPA: hypothetical protein PKX50_06260 [Thermomonas sp.]|jgi:hypothetical protein|nr:hypothetical protein [Thermomonas sp.]
MHHCNKLTLACIIACAALAPAAHADSITNGKQAAEQCVKYQHASSDKRIASCCADMLDGAGGKAAQQECVKTGKAMVGEKKAAAPSKG